MTQFTEAVYTHGVLKPTTDLDLREDQRVRIIVEPIDEQRPERSGALARLKAGIASMQFSSDGRLPSRAELHDRA
jgi:predicted DNA-binding antitoxin AbrB/MazE fold protein